MKLFSALIAGAAALALATGADAAPKRTPSKPAPKAAAKAPAPADAAPSDPAPWPGIETLPAAETPPTDAPSAEPPPSDAPPPEAAPADAAPDAAPSEAPAAEPAPATVKPPAPDMTAGVKRRYRIASTAELTRSGQTQSRANQQTVELEVTGGKPSRPVIRYVITAGEGKDDALGDALLAASKGVATDYEADAAGRPQKLVEWEKVRATILERLLLDPSAPLDGAKRTRTALTSMDGVAAVQFAVPEMSIIGDMQAWPELPIGRTDDEPRVSGAGDQEARLVTHREAQPAAEGACVIRLKGVTELDPKSPVAKTRAMAVKIETEAEVSAVDGWVVSLKQVKTQLAGPQKEIRTWTITREDPPACPGA